MRALRAARPGQWGPVAIQGYALDTGELVLETSGWMSNRWQVVVAGWQDTVVVAARDGLKAVRPPDRIGG